MFQIILKTPGSQGQKINLPDGVYMVGADSGNHLCLNAPGVSRVHCRLSVRGALRCTRYRSAGGIPGENCVHECGRRREVRGRGISCHD